MFTEADTVRGLMEHPGMEQYFGLFCPEEFIDMLTPEQRELPLRELRENIRMPWGMPYPSDLLLKAAGQVYSMQTEGSWRSLPLWSVVDPSVTLNLKSPGKECVSLLIRKDEQAEVKPAVIICPGGGYNMSASYSEGVDLAEMMAGEGWRPFVLNYRVKPNRFPIPNLDLALAVKYVRANAAEFRIDPDNLMLMGSSAGGHLVGMAAVSFEEYDRMLMDELRELNPALARQYEGISVRPDRLCMNYPLVSFADKKWQEGVPRDDFVGASEEERRKASLEYYDLSSFPKTYMWICEDDDLIELRAVFRVADMLKKSGADIMFRLFPTGRHGCGRAVGTSAEGWMEEMAAFMKA